MNSQMPVIAVQTFNKSDTVIQTLDSIEACDLSNEMGLLIVQDGLEGNRLMGKYANEHKMTHDAISSWIDRKKDSFSFVKFLPQSMGRGTAGTAKFLIDSSMSYSESVIFTEDDVIFEHNALVWFHTMLRHDTFLEKSTWGIAGESKYFDLKGRQATELQKRDALTFARKNGLINRFSLLKLMPSSCFATVSEKWAEFSSTRGEAHGPRKVVERCQNENKNVIWPIIARCSDIGMHHQSGYSMTLKKSADKIPGKSTYVNSGTLPYSSQNFLEISREQRVSSQKYFGS